MSLRMTTDWPDWLIAVRSAETFCPFAQTRVMVGPDPIEKSDEPAITAFIEPMPMMLRILTLSPCFDQRC